jgi:hypothetical protein
MMIVEMATYSHASGIARPVVCNTGARQKGNKMNWILRKICERLNKRFLNGKILFSVFVPVGYVIIGTGESAIDTWIKNSKDLELMELKAAPVQQTTSASTPLCSACGMPLLPPIPGPCSNRGCIKYNE